MHQLYHQFLPWGIYIAKFEFSESHLASGILQRLSLPLVCVKGDCESFTLDLHSEMHSGQQAEDKSSLSTEGGP